MHFLYTSLENQPERGGKRFRGRRARRCSWLQILQGVQILDGVQDAGEREKVKVNVNVKRNELATSLGLT